VARRTKEQAEQTKQALLDTALEMFSQQGISQTSLKAVAAGAGVTHGALYWHFKNRHDLVSSLYQERRLPLNTLFLDQLQAARQDALSAITIYLSEWVSLVVENPTWQRCWRTFHQAPQRCAELEDLSSQLNEERTQWHDQLSKLIKKARKQKQLRSKPKHKPDLLADNLMILVQGLINASLTSPPLCRDHSQAKQIIQGYLKGISR